jgi:hypothetical protein
MNQKPKMFRCLTTGLWKCVLEGVQGTGTTKHWAYSQWKALNVSLKEAA